MFLISQSEMCLNIITVNGFSGYFITALSDVTEFRSLIKEDLKLATK